MLDKRTIRKKKLAADKEIEDLAKQADSNSLLPRTRSNSIARKSVTSVTSGLLGKGQLLPEVSQKSASGRRSAAQAEGASKNKILSTLQPRSNSVAARKK